MWSIIDTIRKIVKREVEQIYTTELGLVTAVFPHASDSDKDNYQCSVILKNKKQPDGSDFELRKVPIATPHIGLANIPNIGDLVLLSFIGGNINAPVIIGRLYNDEDIPPVNDTRQIILSEAETIIITTDSGAKIEINGSGEIIMNEGSNGAARLDDTVEVEIPSGTFLTAAQAGVMNPAPVTVTGKITSSSSTVKIGD